jgi:hypothetical protein
MCLNNQQRVAKSIRNGSSKPNPVSAKLCKNFAYKEKLFKFVAENKEKLSVEELKDVGKLIWIKISI